MTSKEYLNQAYHINSRIECKLQQVESLRNLATRVTSVFIDMPHCTTTDNCKLEKTITKIIDLENEIDADIDKLVDLKKEISNVINSVENEEYRIILEMRYLNFKTWEEIAVALHYTVRWIYKLHSKALQKIKTRH